MTAEGHQAPRLRSFRSARSSAEAPSLLGAPERFEPELLRGELDRLHQPNLLQHRRQHPQPLTLGPEQLAVDQLHLLRQDAVKRMKAVDVPPPTLQSDVPR